MACILTSPDLSLLNTLTGLTSETTHSIHDWLIAKLSSSISVEFYSTNIAQTATAMKSAFVL